MENMIRFDSKPELKAPYFIECLPGIGNVGKVSGDFIADGVKAERFATIYSPHFPPQVMLDDECVVNLANNELWFAKDVKGKDIIFLKGECQGSTAEGQFELCQMIMDEIISKYDVSRIVTLGGYGTGNMVDEPKVYGAVSDKTLKEEFEAYGTVFSPGDPQAGIVGASGLLMGLGKVYGIPSICLMGETSGYFVDHKSAMAVVGILMKMLDVEMDTKELSEKSDQIDALTAKVKEFEDQSNDDDLSYIG